MRLFVGEKYLIFNSHFEECGFIYGKIYKKISSTDKEVFVLRTIDGYPHSQHWLLGSKFLTESDWIIKERDRKLKKIGI